MANNQYTWFDGKYIPTEEAKVSILTHSLQYGSGIFEGIRAYDTPKGPAIFRLQDHIKRFFDTAKIYRINLKFTRAEIEKATTELLRRNKLADAYIRPFAFYNSVGIGFSTEGKPISVTISAVPFGSLFGDKKELRCKISSWHRINSSILPAGAKASGNYINSILASKEAKDSGYDEAILFSNSGKTLAEGPGENIFIVKNGILITPPESADILIGITRDTVIQIAKAKGIMVIERDIRREEMYTCDEAFFSGTAAGITSIISVDSVDIGDGKKGPITSKIATEYKMIVSGKDHSHSGWLTFVK